MVNISNEQGGEQKNILRVLDQIDGQAIDCLKSFEFSLSKQEEPVTQIEPVTTTAHSLKGSETSQNR